MLRFLGEWWMSSAIVDGCGIAFEGPGNALPVEDGQLDHADSPWKAVAPEFLQLVQDRAALRRFCKGRSLEVPEGLAAEEFGAVSAWALKRGRFPLALKSARNDSGGRGVFRLEGFRELPKFFEAIRKQSPGPVLIEDWLGVQTILEVTCGPEGRRFIAQVGLERSLRARTTWRMFPIALTDRFRQKLDEVLGVFSPWLAGAGVLVRFTLGVVEGRFVLLSVSGGVNRPEYFSAWAGPIGVRPLLGAGTPGEVPSGKGMGRLLYLHRPAKGPGFPAEAPPGASGLGVVNYLAVGHQAVVLLRGMEPTALQRAGRSVVTLFGEQESES